MVVLITEWHCSFPERTNSDATEDSAFHFRFRHSSPDVLCQTANEDPAYWYGFCLFRQQRDTAVKRNYRQKSLVLVSQHDYAPLFAYLIKTISLLDFEVSPTLIESACSNIAAWGPPEVGLQELPFLGSLLDVHMYILPPCRNVIHGIARFLWELGRPDYVSPVAGAFNAVSDVVNPLDSGAFVRSREPLLNKWQLLVLPIPHFHYKGS